MQKISKICISNVQNDQSREKNAMKLTVVDESCRPEPQLSAALACGVHDAEVVDPRPQHGAVSRAQLCYAA